MQNRLVMIFFGQKKKQTNKRKHKRKFQIHNSIFVFLTSWDGLVPESLMTCGWADTSDMIRISSWKIRVLVSTSLSFIWSLIIKCLTAMRTLRHSASHTVANQPSPTRSRNKISFRGIWRGWLYFDWFLRDFLNFFSHFGI